MKAWLWILIVSLPACNAGGTPVMCDMCSSDDDTSCDGPKVPCSSQVTECVTSVVQVTRGDKTDKTFSKSCADPCMCNINYTVTVNDTHIEARSVCFLPDKYDKTLPAIPPRNKIENGLQCPFCFGYGLGGCKPVGMMNCAGLETKCVSYSGPLYGDDGCVTGSYQGCGTPSSCPSDCTDCQAPKMTCSEATRRSK